MRELHETRRADAVSKLCADVLASLIRDLNLRTPATAFGGRIAAKRRAARLTDQFTLCIVCFHTSLLLPQSSR